MNRYVIIVAGGKGLRMGSDLPKQFIPVGGKPILMHTVEKFAQWDPRARLLLVLPAEHQDYWRMLCREIGCRAEHRIVTGGETRFHSVRNALDVVKQDPDLGDDDLIAVHDGVRPFVSEKVITDCFHVAAESGAVVAALPMVDSLREVQPDSLRTMPRLWRPWENTSRWFRRTGRISRLPRRWTWLSRGSYWEHNYLRNLNYRKTSAAFYNLIR